jgi:hypothetical protein
MLPSDASTGGLPARPRELLVLPLSDLQHAHITEIA